MALPDRVSNLFQEHPELLPLKPIHGWKSAPDEGGHTRCESYRGTIYRGDPVVGTYLQYISVVFCPACVEANRVMFDGWLQRP